MKLPACIFSFIFGLLTLQPLFKNDYAEATGCCSKEECHKPSQKKDCDTNSCNPFLACALGNYYLVETFFTPANTFTKKIKKPVSFNDNRICTNISDFWHPPELI